MTKSSLIHLVGSVALGAGLLSAQSAEDLRLTIGKSVVIDYPSDVRQISTSNPDVIDASPVTTREILLHGKGLGSATMVVWSKGGQRTFYNVNVDLNLDPLRRMLHEAFPDEKILPVTSRDSIVLDGQVSSKEVVDRAAVIAAAFAKTVVNNLSLNAAGIDKQILLRVKFAELDRSRELQYGVNLLGIAGQTQISGGTGQFNAASLTGNSSITGGTATTGANGTAGNSALSITKALSIFAFNPNLNLGAFVQALQQESILEVLTEPNLVASNGKEATFLVGGEFPVPILQGGANSGAVTIQFREFGIKLIFTPLITANKTIKMHLKQEVSTLDFANGVTISGFTIPALSTRRAETDVELSEGQSFVVAGLVDNRESDSFSKIPILSSLPIFGALFKSKDEKKQRTDLVVLVTPEITEPLGATDPRPSLYMPKDFLVRLDQKDAPPQSAKKSSKRN
jgi:pilus assembly protein CpaC